LIGPRQDDLPVVDRRHLGRRLGGQQAECFTNLGIGAKRRGDAEQSAPDRRKKPFVLALGFGIVGGCELIKAVGDGQATA